MPERMQNIAIVGGTHGNETSGTTLLHPQYQQVLCNAYPELSLEFVAANPKAIAANVRFTEADLNRQFTLDNLAASATTYEQQRAQALNDQLGPKQAPSRDLIIDVHNTTSNMGATLIVLQLDAFHIGMARYVKQKMPEAVILVEDEKPPQEHGYLCTLGKKGVMVEVGGQPQGVCRADIFDLALRMTQHILSYCQWQQTAKDKDIQALPEVEAFRLGSEVSFPLNDKGERIAMIHNQLQDQDFQALHNGDPVFLHYDGTQTRWQDKTTYPHFINEAAYHHLNIAFATADRITL